MKMTEEERSRLCVAKFRDMSDEMLSEMPGTVKELAEKYYSSTRKLKKLGKVFTDISEHLPPEAMIHIMVELSAELVTSGEKTLEEVIADLEEMKQKVEH